jgi:uncharacterized protein (DUF169 family)
MLGIALLEQPVDALPVVEARRTHCRFMGLALGGEPLQAHRKKISCPLASYYLGEEEASVESAADFLMEVGDADDPELARLYVDAGWRLEGRGPYVAYFEYPHPAIEPEVLIRIGTPLELGPLLHTYAKRTGSRLMAAVSGLGAACGECVVYPILSGMPNLSLGCKGCRRSMRLGPDKALLAAPRSSELFDLLKEEP